MRACSRTPTAAVRPRLRSPWCRRWPVGDAWRRTASRCKRCQLASARGLSVRERRGRRGSKTVPLRSRNEPGSGSTGSAASAPIRRDRARRCIIHHRAGPAASAARAPIVRRARRCGLRPGADHPRNRLPIQPVRRGRRRRRRPAGPAGSCCRCPDRDRRKPARRARSGPGPRGTEHRSISHGISLPTDGGSVCRLTPHRHNSFTKLQHFCHQETRAAGLRRRPTAADGAQGNEFWIRGLHDDGLSASARRGLPRPGRIWPIAAVLFALASVLGRWRTISTRRRRRTPSRLRSARPPSPSPSG